MFRFVLVAVLVIIGEVGHAAEPVAWLCLPARTRPMESCFLHSSDSRASYDACVAAARKLPQTRPRARIDRGAWVAFPDSGHRCLPIPHAGARVQIENRGRRVASWKLRVPEPCASRVLDVVGPNDYGAMWSRCTRRDTSADERLTP